MEATFIKKLVGDWRGEASLYRCVPPMGDHEYVIVSAVTTSSGPEAYIFPADESGEVKDWGELPGSYRGGLDHAEALKGAGYRLACDRDIDIGDGVDEQKRMVERDEPAKAAQPVPSDPIAALWQAIGLYSVQVSETGECAPPAELLAAVEAIQKALTPPAPPKPGPKTADFSAVAPMERLGATRWGA